ncbi:MAG: aminopeptidase [Pseudomonas sp.]|nr:aminopeptidase [Pseudomonas sp.]
MNRHLLATAVAAAVLAALAACNRAAPEADTASAPATAASDAAAPATDAAPAAATDLEQLAERLVTQAAAVKEGEVVWISGRPHDAELLENIAVHVRKVGGFPIVGYSSDRLAKRLFFDVPAKYDSQPDALGMAMADLIDVNISLGNAMSENLLEGADPARTAARGKADEATMQAFMRNRVRTVEVGNDLYPTPWRAQRYGMDEATLARTFWDGVNLDYTQLQARADQVKSALAAGDAVHVTHPNGTDLRLRIQGRTIAASDGILSADDLTGGVPPAIYLPAGEVYTTPVPGSAEGKVVSTRSYFRGKPIDNLTVTFSGGKATAMTGSGEGFAGLKAEYDAVDDARKNEFAFIDFGINPNVTLPANSTVGTWVPAGAVTVGIGSNIWAGGDNGITYGLTMSLPGSTVTLDDTPIVDKGALKL